MYRRKKQDQRDAESRKQQYLAFGAGIGIAIGAGIGVAMGGLALGISIGIAIGAGVGIALAANVK